MRMRKILVIEDQEAPWENYLLALTQICHIPEADITRARWYTEAEEKIASGTYDIVFLDHRMPYDDPGCTDASDFGKFVESLQGIGYNLTALLQSKQPQAVVVGTSSLNPKDFGPYKFPTLKLDKTNIFDELPAIIKNLTA